MIANTTLFSNALKTNVNINFFIPTPEGQEQITDSAVQQKYNYEKGLPVVYLLHGAFGNYNSWLRFSCVERYAQKYGCVLVMASAENSFYHDMSRGNSYYTFFSKELPALVQSILPVSRRREDTYIAGFSMGGYGSWYIALNNPQNYCKAASLSGALDVPLLYELNKSGKDNHPIEWENIFGNPENLRGSSSDLLALYDKNADASALPALYQSCGTEDALLGMNRGIRDELAKRGANLVYEESEGGHDWDFWDSNIRRVLAWMFGK